MSSTKLVLYSSWLSSCSYRVRIALNLKQLDYDVKSIHSENKDEELGPVSPTEYIPAICVDGHILIESVAIMHYLDEAYPNSYQLLPSDVLMRCKVREIVEVIVSGVQPLQNTCVLESVDKAKRTEWVQHWITRGLRAVEKLLMTSAGKYCVGDAITMADCCLMPQLYNARARFNMDLSPFPTIERIEKELMNYPAFVAAHPSNQPDFPEKMNYGNEMNDSVTHL